jgi:hypothetical protein
MFNDAQSRRLRHILSQFALNTGSGANPSGHLCEMTAS